MNTPLFPVAIYPSQLDAFKTKAELLSTSISEALSIKKLSAFKRNDYLAIGLGYKGHPDLIESTKFRVSSDTEQQLLIFSNKAVSESITEIFSKKLNTSNIESILECCKMLGQQEVIDSIPATDISDLKRASEAEINVIMGNANNSIAMYLDEEGNSPEAIKQRQGAAKFLTGQDIKNTPKKTNINVVIDLSEVPINIGEEFYDHRQWLKFENEVKLRNRHHNVIFKLNEPKTNNGEKVQWQIRASIDTWSEIEPTSNLLTTWNEFKGWLMSFFATERIHVTERINSHRWITPVVQFHVNNPIEHQLSKLTKLEDITLFNLLAIKKDQYGHVFESEVADIDFKDVLARNKNIYVNLDALDKVSSTGKGKHPLSSLVESVHKAQRKDVAQAKQALALKLSENYGADIHELCEHPITDTLGDVVEGQQDHRCLVCDKRWFEKPSLWNKQNMKDHVDAIGQGTGKSRIAINLDESPYVPIIPDATLADLIQLVESCWPEGATCATQEADGEILYWSANVQDVLKARQAANTDDGLMPYIGSKYQVHANYYEIAEQAYVASNWQTSVVTPIDVNF